MKCVPLADGNGPSSSTKPAGSRFVPVKISLVFMSKESSGQDALGGDGQI